MKKLLVLTILALFAMALVWGCGQKADEGTDKTPADVAEAEAADETKLDSMADSLQAEAEEAVEEAVEEAGEAVEEAVEDVTGDK